MYNPLGAGSHELGPGGPDVQAEAEIAEWESAYQESVSGLTSIEEMQLLTEAEYWELKERWGAVFDAGMGAEALYDIFVAEIRALGLPVATGPAKQAGRTSEYEGKLYYFDTDGCKQRFDKDPQHYLSGSSETATPKLYPELPTSPDLLLRLRRDAIRALPQGKGLAPLENPPPAPQVKPAVPSMPPAAPPSAPPQSPAPQAAPAPPQTPQAAVPQPQTPPAEPPPPPSHPDGGGHQDD